MSGANKRSFQPTSPWSKANYRIENKRREFPTIFKWQNPCQGLYSQTEPNSPRPATNQWSYSCLPIRKYRQRPRCSVPNPPYNCIKNTWTTWGSKTESSTHSWTDKPHGQGLSSRKLVKDDRRLTWRGCEYYLANPEARRCEDER